MCTEKLTNNNNLDVELETLKQLKNVSIISFVSDIIGVMHNHLYNDLDRLSVKIDIETYKKVVTLRSVTLFKHFCIAFVNLEYYYTCIQRYT